MKNCQSEIKAGSFDPMKYYFTVNIPAACTDA